MTQLLTMNTTHKFPMYQFPGWSVGLGWMITALSLVSIPLVGLLQVYRAPGKTVAEKFLSSWKSK